MKFYRKIYIYLLVAVICFSSVMCSYEKANSCKAASIALEIGLSVFVGAVLCGAYVVATDEEIQEDLKETYTDYKNATKENCKMLYEQNKKLFNDFVAYAEENGAGSMCLYSSAGSSYTVAELSQAGFPDFDEWDDYFKKSSGSGGGWKNIFDKILLGADLIGLMKSFCNDEFYSDGINGQLFYTGDDGYVNRETGAINIKWEVREYHYDKNTYDYRIGELVDTVDYFSKDKEDFRICITVWPGYSYNGYNYWYDRSSNNILNRHICLRIFVGCKDVNGRYITWCYFPSSYNGGKVNDYDCFSASFGSQFSEKSNVKNLIYSRSYYEPWGRNFADSDWAYFPDYISSNIPFFANYSEAYNYLTFNDSKVDVDNKLCNTPSDKFIDNYSNTYITINNIINDVTGVDHEPTVAPVGDLTATPVPTLLVENDNDVTNNYIISITNILQPIQQTVTNIYNFFIIDTEKIELEIDNIDVTPASKFTNFVQTFSNLKNTFSDSTQDELNVAGSSQKGIVYPVLKVQCPQILTDFLPDNDDVVLFEDDIAYIILCDCGKYAVQFGAVRLILKAVMWFGFIFYVLRELKVVITLSS